MTTIEIRPGNTTGLSHTSSETSKAIHDLGTQMETWAVQLRAPLMRSLMDKHKVPVSDAEAAVKALADALKYAGSACINAGQELGAVVDAVDNLLDTANQGHGRTVTRIDTGIW